MEEVVRRCDFVPANKSEACQARIEDNQPFAIVIDRTEFHLDFCTRHQDEMRKAMKPFMKFSRPVRSHAGRATRKAMRGKTGVFTTKDVRNWLREQGIDVAESGRLPEYLIEKYRESQVAS